MTDGKNMNRRSISIWILTKRGSASLKPAKQKLTNSQTGRKQDDDFEEILQKRPGECAGKIHCRSRTYLGPRFKN
ncbi:hypothetical protein [Zhengella mangrovi]|uniref:hypothetical protein n=1 Tax=Zhengella mangrovi TaxID=1982044 RepID=UPI0010563CFD|nr:hypothetical protein [Zhengella mangrovi]